MKGAEMTMIANTPSAVSVADARRSCASSTSWRSWRICRRCHTMDITDEIAEALDE
ncbi:MAG: hypothetical protein ACLSDQ_02950 [Adlercreutzia equolifaciens]